MKIVTIILLIIALAFNSCASTKNKATNNNKRMEFTITKIQNEKDGQTLFLEDDKGGKFTTVISIPNGNFVDVKTGNRISLVAKEILEMHPAIIISEDIKVLKGKLTTTISTDKKLYKVGEPIELSMELKNLDKNPYRFLPWATPLENRFTGGCLNVFYNDNLVSYSGIMIKRIAPIEKDYVKLKQNEVYSGKVNLLDGYKLIEKGTYSIQFKKNFKGLPTSNVVMITIK